MDKEKLLKKYILAFTIQAVSACSYWFLFLSRKELDIGKLYLIPLLLLLVSSIYIEKNYTRIMPMILSIYDTIEKFEKQNILLYVILFIWFVPSFFLVLKSDGILSNILPSLIFLVFPFINVNNKRIEYLKNKPEGLNF